MSEFYTELGHKATCLLLHPQWSGGSGLFPWRLGGGCSFSYNPPPPKVHGFHKARWEAFTIASESFDAQDRLSGTVCS